MKIIIILLTLMLASCAHQNVYKLVNTPEENFSYRESTKYLSEQALQKIVGLQSKRFEGIVSCNQGKVSKGLDQLKETYSPKRGKTLYWIHVGNCLALDQQYTKALFFYQRALAAKSSSSKLKAAIYNNMATVYHYRRNLLKSISLYKRASKLSRSIRSSRFNLAQIYLQVGKYRSALALLKEISSRAAKDNQVNFAMAITYYHLGQFKRSLALIAKIDSDLLKREDIALLYASVLYSSGDIKGAQEILNSRRNVGEFKLDSACEEFERKLDLELKKNEKRDA